MRFHTLLCLAVLTTPSWASEVKVENAWIRVPAPGQVVVGGFLNITSQKDASLLGVKSPAAGMVEMHEMSMSDGVMRMRPVEKIDLPKEKIVKLEPGGLHLMLMDLKQPLKAGAKVPLTLTVKSGAHIEQVQVSAEVRSMMSAAPVHMRH